jgi:N-carbamoyl-L-amino-acid hydrolase
MKINNRRFKSKFFNLAQIGATPNGGVHRPSFSEEHFQARNWFRTQTISSGFDFKIDGAGNHIARIDCGVSGAPTLILGSHLDSVPDGGRYDGALGVVAALEVLLSIKDADLKLPIHLEAIDFTDEEGTFIGLLGSSAQGGKIRAADLTETRGRKDGLVSGLTRSGLTPETIIHAARKPSTLAGYLELHIEQGSKLIDTKADIGIVTSIVGIYSFIINFIGRADHAGTTSMFSRLDPSQGASAFTLACHSLVKKSFPECVINIGNMDFFPGAFNIVPEKVAVSLEFRAPNSSLLSQLKSEIINVAKETSKLYNLGVEIENLGKHDPALMSQSIQDAISEASTVLGLKSILLPSGAGHDAQSFADICPTGMIFIPSIKGASHSSREYTPWNDCENGANVLLHTTIVTCKHYSLKQ